MTDDLVEIPNIDQVGEIQAMPEVIAHGESALFAADRARYWESLRSLGPVVKIAGQNGYNGYYLTRRADILRAARDPDTFQSCWRELPVVTESGPLPRVPLTCSPRDHLRFARILHRLFAPSALAPYEQAIRAQAAVLIDALAPTGRCEVTGAIAYIWPTQALLAVMGLPPEDAPRMAAWMHAGAADDADAQLELLHYLTATIAERFDRGEPGLLWQLMENLDAGDFTTEEMLGLLVVVFIGAVNGVTDAIGHALWCLARDPRLRARLRGNPQRIEVFISEVLRLYVAATLPRVTTRCVTIGGVTIEPGALVLLPLESANREDTGDEMAEDAGLRVDRHASFGAGLYRCPASVLARMELTVLVDEWLRRIPEFAAEEGFTPEILALPRLALSGLPLHWAPRAGAAR